MGRLLKKKPESKKRKKRTDDDNSASNQMQNGGVEKKTAPFAGFAKSTLKETLFRKKESTGVKSPNKAEQGKNYLEQGLQFLREVRVELKKVTWPPRTQALGSTVVVIVLVMIISLFLGLVDIGLSNIVRWVLH